MSSPLERGTTDLPIFQAISQNLKNLPKSFTWGALLSGFLIVDFHPLHQNLHSNMEGKILYSLRMVKSNFFV